MSEKKEQEGSKKEHEALKKTKSVRFSANIAVNDRGHSDEEDETDGCFDDSKDDISNSGFDVEEFSRLKTESEELQEVLYDFYHDSKMMGKNGNILIGDIESHPSESISSLVCRVLVNYDKLCEENRILAEEKTKLDEDKVQLCNSMAKLREQLHDAVDSNIEEIEDLNRENEDLRSQVQTFDGKNSEVVSALVQAREQYINRLRALTELSKDCSTDKLLQRLKNDSLEADIELKKAKELVEKDRKEKLKRAQSLPSTLRQDSTECSERGGLLRELKTCKNLQESQRKQIQKILDEKLDLETQVSELKRQVVLLKAERRVNVKTKSKLVQTEGEEQSVPKADGEKNGMPSASSEVECLSRRCKDLENKLEDVRREKLTVEREKTSLLLSLDWNIEQKDALEEQLTTLQGKVNGQKASNETCAVFTQTNDSSDAVEKPLSQTDGGFRASYKGISEAKVELEKIRVQEQEKQIAMLKRENDAVKEKLKKAEDMSQTLQNLLKDLTDEKHELLDSIEELNEEKAELEEARSKLEKELGGTKQEKFVADEVSDIRNKERKVGDNLEASKAKLAQLDLKVVEVLALIGDEETGKKEKESDIDKGVEDMIGSLLSTVEDLKDTVITFKTTYEKTKGDSVRTQNELQALSREKTELQSFVEKLTKQNRKLSESLENNNKSQTSHENNIERLKRESSRLEKELGQVRGAKTAYEKSLAESRRREEDLGRQLKNLFTKRDDLQRAFDEMARKSVEASSLLSGATKEVEVFRATNEKLTTELEQLREELEGTVEDRDELLELLDRIVCENGTGDDGKQGLGLKVERIRERSKSEEALPGIGLNDSDRTKPVEEKLVVSREMNVEYASAGENELFAEDEKRSVKGMEVLQEENQKLKEMVEKILNDQKNMEVVLNSLAEANAEIQQGLEESLEHTEQIRLQGSENGRGQDAVYFAPDYHRVSSDENAELRRLHEAMVGTNEALNTNLRRLHDEKTRSEQLRTSFQDVTRKNAALEKDVESLTEAKERAEKDILELKKKLRDLEREAQRAKNEKLDVESMLDENNGQVKVLKFQIDSLTEINQDLRETNEKLSVSSKEIEKKWTKLNDKFDEVEFQNEDLEKDKKRLEKELVEHGKLKTGLELELEESKKSIAALQSEVSSCTEKCCELEKSLGTSTREQEALRETAGKVTKLEENNGKVKVLKFQIDSLTEINQDLRETNEKLSVSTKEIEKKWTKLNDKFDEVEFQNEDLEKDKKRLEKELAEHGKLNTGLELELEESKKSIAALQSEVSSCTEKCRELEKSLGTSTRELEALRETAGKVTKLEQDAQDANEMMKAMEKVKKALSEREKRVTELESEVTRLKKEIQNSQRFVKAVSQENDTLRDSLSVWEQEASKIRQHVHQLSQDADGHNQNGEESKSSKSQDVDKVRSVKAFEAMQVEMDSVNEHLKSLTTENKKLNARLDAVTKENSAIKDRNIQLLTRFDMVSKELEKKTAEVAKLSKEAKNGDSRSKKDKNANEKSSLQVKIEKLVLENTLLKRSLANALDEEKRIAENLKNLLDVQKGTKVRRQDGGGSESRRPKDIVSEEWEIRTEISGLATTKPDLIRDSTEVKDEFRIVEERKYRSQLSTVETSGTGADTQELLADLLKGQMNLKSYCQEITQVLNEVLVKAKDSVDGALNATKAALEESKVTNKELESNLEEKEEELAKLNEEKAKLDSEAVAVKEKCDKLQAVFRALILVMNDKKGGAKKGEEDAEGPTRILDYIKRIKTKLTTLESDKENLEKKVVALQEEIDEQKARAVRSKRRNSGETKDGTKSASGEKEKILNELLLGSARDKRRLLEKLQEIFDEFSKVKSKLDAELENQSSKSPNLEKINQEFSESVMHTERFIQSVAHDRPVTVVADSTDEKDPSLELAKENEELIGRISAIQSSRRRESKNLKEEIRKMEKNKEEAVKEEETKWKEEMEKVKGEFEKKMKEKEQAATEVKNSLKQEVGQLKLEIRRVSDEHEVAQRTMRSEARLATKKLEEKIKGLKGEMEKKVAERETRMAEAKRKADADAQENARMAEAEISQVRANWADAERKLRSASEEKVDAVRQLERVKQERSENGAKSARELQKLMVALESAQKQASDREDVFKRERDRLQRMISNLEGAVRNSEVSGLERTQARIGEFQRSLEELTKKYQQLETAKRNSEQSLGAEVERLKYENSKLQRDLWEHNQQRRIVGGNEVQRPSVPSGERMKVMGTVRQPIEKPRIVTPVESTPGTIPGDFVGTVRQPPVEKARIVTPVESAPGAFPGDPQRRVKVREGQATAVHVTRVQDQGVRRGSDNRDPVFNELGAMFKQLNETPEWTDESRDSGPVIQARPMQARVQAPPPVQTQKPQPEWESRQDRTWPMKKDSPRYSASNTRHKDPHVPPVRAQPTAQPASQRTGYHKDDSRQRPTYSNSQPITRQVQNTVESANMTSSDARRTAEVKKVPAKEQPHSTKSRRPRRPSVGSDDVFLTNNSGLASTLTSHGSKTGDFWRSRSLTDLTDSTEDRPIKQSGHSGARVPHEKLPKSFSGPRKGGDPSRAAQGRGTGREPVVTPKKVTPLKGMEYVLFQSQI